MGEGEGSFRRRPGLGKATITVDGRAREAISGVEGGAGSVAGFARPCKAFPRDMVDD